MTLEFATAAAGALFVFFLLLWLMRGKGGMTAALPGPKNPIGFAPPA